MIDNKYGEKFKIEGPATIRVFSRYMIGNNADKNIDSYVMKFYEDEKWVSEFDVNIVKSVKNARIVNKGFDDYDLSKFKSFYYNVPSGTHYYTVKIPVASEDNKFIFKVRNMKLNKNIKFLCCLVIFSFVLTKDFSFNSNVFLVTILTRLRLSSNEISNLEFQPSNIRKC